MSRLPFLLTGLPLAALMACGGDGPTPPPPGGPAAEVSFAFVGNPGDTLRVLIRGATAIADVEAYLATQDGPRIPAGTIVRGAGADARYPFHFLPESVQLVDAAVEPCDGRPMRTPAEVGEYMRGATGDAHSERAPWCPWTAYPVRIVPLAQPNDG